MRAELGAPNSTGRPTARVVTVPSAANTTVARATETSFLRVVMRIARESLSAWPSGPAVGHADVLPGPTTLIHRGAPGEKERSYRARNQAWCTFLEQTSNFNGLRALQHNFQLTEPKCASGIFTKGGFSMRRLRYVNAPP